MNEPCFCVSPPCADCPNVEARIIQGMIADAAAQTRWCPICGAQMISVGAVWVCPRQRDEPTCITPERRQRIRDVIAHRIPGAPF